MNGNAWVEWEECIFITMRMQCKWSYKILYHEYTLQCFDIECFVKNLSKILNAIVCNATHGPKKTEQNRKTCREMSCNYMHLMGCVPRILCYEVSSGCVICTVEQNNITCWNTPCWYIDVFQSNYCNKIWINWRSHHTVCFSDWHLIIIVHNGECIFLQKLPSLKNTNIKCFRPMFALHSKYCSEKKNTICRAILAFQTKLEKQRISDSTICYI